VKHEALPQIQLGRLRLRNGLWLAPMAGITNGPFRLLCARGGAGLVVTEMVSADSLRYGNRKSMRMLDITPGERPVAIQIFGADPQAMALAAKLAEEAGADVIDINAGCPVKKVLKAGAGSALMKRPALLADITAAVVNAVKVPVTVKTRVGLKAGAVLGPELARLAEGEGAAAVVIHGRYAEAFHTGPVDLDAVAATAAAVKIPVIGNGGVKDAAGARGMLEAGCAGISIGRAAAGNPFIFSDIAGVLSGSAAEERRPQDALKLFLEFLELNCGVYGPENGVVRARKLIGYWLKGLKGAAALRGAFMEKKTLNEARTLLVEYLHSAR
jgi:nifR3 family TIM-barrel protein